MTLNAEFRNRRAEIMEQHDPYFIFLRPQDKQDVIDGKCRYTVCGGVPILDYSNPPWFGSD